MIEKSADSIFAEPKSRSKTRSRVKVRFNIVRVVQMMSQIIGEPISQSRFSKTIGVSQPNISNHLRGKKVNYVELGMLAAIMETFNIPPDQLHTLFDIEIDESDLDVREYEVIGVEEKPKSKPEFEEIVGHDNAIDLDSILE